MNGTIENPGENGDLSELGRNLEASMEELSEGLSDLWEEFMTEIEAWLAEMGLDIDLNPPMLEIKTREDGSFYVVNPESREIIDIEPTLIDTNEDGQIDNTELEAYATAYPDAADLALLQAAFGGLIEEEVVAADGSSDFVHVEEGEVDRASRRTFDAPENVGERFPDTSLYNMKQKANIGGCGTTTSGEPGTNSNHYNTNANRERLRSANPEWHGFSDAAIDILYAAVNQDVDIFVAIGETRATTERAVNEVNNSEYGRQNSLNLMCIKVGIDTSAQFSQTNINAIAAVMPKIYEGGHKINYNCKHGAHRGPSLQLMCYIVHERCTLEEALRANGVSADYLEKYPNFMAQMRQVPSHANEINELRDA